MALGVGVVIHPEDLALQVYGQSAWSGGVIDFVLATGSASPSAVPRLSPTRERARRP